MTVSETSKQTFHPRWNTFSEKSHSVFEIWKGKVGQFAIQARTKAKSWVNRYHDKSGKEKNEDQNGL